MASFCFFPSGQISEIHFPIDKLTKKPKGFAFVTFLITEHAVKAYAEVDGQIFQVRQKNSKLFETYLVFVVLQGLHF